MERTLELVSLDHTNDPTSKPYFDWIVSIATTRRFHPTWDSHDNKLLWRLFNVEFINEYELDDNRIADGICLRDRYVESTGNEYPVKDSPCSCLELIVALAIRCEEQIMSNTEYGDRTLQWVNHMLLSLELGGVNDENYNEKYVDYILWRWMNHLYEPDGHGGLFWVRNTDKDMRTLQIWDQQSVFLVTCFDY